MRLRNLLKIKGWRSCIVSFAALFGLLCVCFSFIVFEVFLLFKSAPDIIFFSAVLCDLQNAHVPNVFRLCTPPHTGKLYMCPPRHMSFSSGLAHIESSHAVSWCGCACMHSPCDHTTGDNCTDPQYHGTAKRQVQYVTFVTLSRAVWLL